MNEDLNEEKKKNKPSLFETFTKAWVTVLLIISVIDLQLSYLLAYLGRGEIAETLSVAVVTEIVGVIGIYMVRAYFDTYSEKKYKLSLKELDASTPSEESDDYIDDETEEDEETSEETSSESPEFSAKVDEMVDILLGKKDDEEVIDDEIESVSSEEDDDDSVG